MIQSEISKRRKQHQNFALLINSFIVFCAITAITLLIGVIYLSGSFFMKSSETSNKEVAYKVCLEAGKDTPGSTLESITKTCEETIKKLYKDKE